MKNFKRVISAVIALALSASTLVAVSASKFADVDNADSYAGAINTLTALDIIHGYEEEDGLVFKPEGDITRAEAATMIVGALNMTKDAQAAAGTSKFTDVNEKASWASGYVNVGVAQGFINGMDDTTFAPQENVTYAQMCVMLTLITGYGDYAKAYGGYPTGYTTIAAQTGINKGVAVAADTPLKRGQVAQVLYNAMTTSVLGVKNYSLQGNEYAVQDGDDLPFKTILSDKFTGFEAELKIENVPKSKNTLEKNEAEVSLTEDTFLDEVKELKITTPAAFGITTVIDDFGVSDNLYNSGKGILVKDNNKKWHLVYFEADENDTASVQADDYVTVADGGKSATAATNPKVTFGTKDYAVNAGTVLYINGQADTVALSDARLATVLGLSQGEVKFIDDNTAVDGYDKIMVTSYNIGKVAAVTYTNETTTIQVTYKAGLNGAVSTIKFEDEDIADGDVALTVKNADGEAIKLSDIKKDDIIAYAIDPTLATATIKSGTNFKTIDIIVTDETVTGVAKAEDATDKIYTIGDTEYEEVVWASPALTIGTEYTVTLDPFGRIFDAEVQATSAKYAIAEKYDSDLGVQLILPNGTAKYYELDATTVSAAAAILAVVDTSGNGTIELGEFEKYIETTKAAAPAERVVKYTVKNSTGKIQTIDLVGTAATTMQYKAKTEKLGTKTIIDSTAVIDASSYNKNISDYTTFATNSFVDKTDYKASVYTADGAANTAAFIVLTEVGKTINADSRFAVVKKVAVQAQTEDGDTCYKVNVLYEGEEQDLLFTTASGARALAVGDAFFFVTDSEGLVKSYLKVFDYAGYENDNLDAFEGYTKDLDGDSVNETWANVFYNDMKLVAPTGSITGTNSTAFTYKADDWDYTIKNATKKDYQLVYGIVTDVTSKGIEFALETPANRIDLTNDNNYEVFGIDADCVAYRYGINEEKAFANQYKAVTVASATASTLGAYETGAKSDVFNLAGVDGKGHDHLTYALALIVDGDVVEIYTLVQ